MNKKMGKDTFVAIYSFRVKEGATSDFIEGWTGLTRLIYTHNNSMGSKLHALSESEYIAYAQWPDKDTWADTTKKLPPEADQYRQQMRDSCISITTVYELDVVTDLLQDDVYGAD